MEQPATNPVGKIPAPIMNNGESLFDSPVISRYLDSQSENRRLIPSGEKQWAVLRGEALANGNTDAAFSLVMERLRPLEEQSVLWKSRWENAIQRSLCEIENTIEKLATDFNLAQIATAVAICYLEFRLPDLLNETHCPKSLSWLVEFKQRNSMQSTEFQG